MGLLDDAIREHLELKRLRGVDLSKVIHEEQEALGPTLRGEDAVPTKPVVGSEACSTAREDRVCDEAETHSDPSLSRLSQETAELDMQTVLETESFEGDGRVESIRFSR
jgi:hypothetical protein